MRVLLDEQLPRQLAPYLTGHAVRTVQQERWAGLTNGALLRQAEAAGFDLFVTADQNLEFQQNLRTVRLRIVLLEAASNALEDLLPLVPSTLVAMATVQPGQMIRVSDPDTRNVG